MVWEKANYLFFSSSLCCYYYYYYYLRSFSFYFVAILKPLCFHFENRSLSAHWIYFSVVWKENKTLGKSNASTFFFSSPVCFGFGKKKNAIIWVHSLVVYLSLHYFIHKRKKMAICSNEQKKTVYRDENKNGFKHFFISWNIYNLFYSVFCNKLIEYIHFVWPNLCTQFTFFFILYLKL